MINQKEKGFISLMVTVVIATVLMVIAADISLKGFFTRFDLADTQYKEQSRTLAEGCVNAALLNLAKNINYTPPADGETVTVGSDTCNILSISYPNADQIKISAQGIFPPNAPERAFTNLSIVVKNSDLSLVSWDEIPAP